MWQREVLSVVVMVAAADFMCGYTAVNNSGQMLTVIPDAKVYIFNQGGHPAILTNAEEFSQLIQRFLSANRA